ncbi:MAG: lipoprotein [Rhizomicrobium sp.]|jgi:hypothetical protein
MRKILAIAGAALGLASCSLFGGGSEDILYNPQTHQQVNCGQAIHGWPVSTKEANERDRCIAVYTARGFRPATSADLSN